MDTAWSAPFKMALVADFGMPRCCPCMKRWRPSHTRACSTVSVFLGTSGKVISLDRSHANTLLLTLSLPMPLASSGNTQLSVAIRPSTATYWKLTSTYNTTACKYRVQRHYSGDSRRRIALLRYRPHPEGVNPVSVSFNFFSPND